MVGSALFSMNFHLEKQRVGEFLELQSFNKNHFSWPLNFFEMVYVINYEEDLFSHFEILIGSDLKRLSLLFWRYFCYKNPCSD